MRQLANAPWLAVLTIGSVTAACALAGQVTPSGSASPTPVGSAPAVASPTPTASPTASPPEFSEARIAKAGPEGLPPENAPVVFEEVGLPGGQVVSYEVSGDSSASYQCWNPKTGAFGAQQQIRSLLQLRLPPPDTLSCSTGFRAVAYAGKYDHVLLADTTKDIRVDLGTYQFGN